MKRLGTTFTLAVIIAAGPSCAHRELPPLGEALIIVDTDVPVPLLAGRLRVDVYTREGTWYESRDVALPERANWPASFSIFSPDVEKPHDALVRLRTYAEAKLRDYRGERFAARPEGGRPGDPAPVPAEPPGNTPRLLSHGADVTPLTEPLPLVAIDRIVGIRLVPGVRGAARVVMRGACTGTMADLAGRRTCVDKENVRTDVSDVALDPDLTVPHGSALVGKFGAETACDIAARPPSGPGLLDGEVCVPGGVFVLGDGSTAGNADFAAAPERVAIIPPLLVDTFEVAVSRWRAAVARGFKSPDGSPTPNEGPLDLAQSVCTWSAAPRDRERHALTCVTRTAARAFCAFHGGDLLTEAQFEYVALAAGRPRKTRFPWGDDLPTCARAVFGRRPFSTIGGQDVCIAAGTGPQPVDVASGPGGDVSTGAGVVNLVGGVSEWLQDGFHPLTARCWAAAPILDPACRDEDAGSTSLRAAGWASSIVQIDVTVRNRNKDPSSAVYGLRCARPGRRP